MQLYIIGQRLIFYKVNQIGAETESWALKLQVIDQLLISHGQVEGWVTLTGGPNRLMLKN